MRALAAAFLFCLTACSGTPAKLSEADSVTMDANPEAAQKLMCVEEHLGLFRHTRAHMEELCPGIKGQFELICLRFTHNTKDWRQACPGIDTADKLECISVVRNGSSYALLESLQKCRKVTNRKQIFCLSRLISKTSIALLPETVQECLDKNP